jgi:hypothetical protein
LAGFTDGNGCFSASILDTVFRIRFILTQKWDVNKFVLLHIISLFDKFSNTDKTIGAVLPHSIDKVFELRINGVKNCEFLFDYFDNFKLRTKKANFYVKWKILLSFLKKQDHLDPLKRIELIKLCKSLNL